MENAVLIEEPIQSFLMNRSLHTVRDLFYKVCCLEYGTEFCISKLFKIL